MNEIQTILNSQGHNGGRFWSREDGDIHAPHGYSTIDVLNVLGETGATEVSYPVFTEVLNFLFTYQAPDGSFRYAKSSSKLPCMTARILTAIGRIGASEDKRVNISYQQLLESQCSDGGWRCNTVKLEKSPLTDASNPGTTLYVLDSFRFRANSKEELKKLDKGVDFLLQHWDVKEPVGPCNFGIGSRFMKIEYPFLRYNIFYYVYVLSFYPKACNDERFLEAYKHLANKIENGKLIPETPHRAWHKFGFAQKGKVSGPGTKRWLEIEANMKKYNNKV